MPVPTSSSLPRSRAAFLVAALCLLASAARADDVLHLGAATVDRPTLVTLGVQLPISGDDDHDAQVTARYRVHGSPTWRDALPLFRVHPEDVVVGPPIPEQFAGSIFDLAPATEYDLELHAVDADGPVDAIVTLSATTRGVPADPAAPVVRAVASAAALQAALDAAASGDVITLADGVYGGPFELAASGTAANPIVVRGASATGAILDGGGCACNLLEITGSYVHVERLTLRKAERGLRFKGTGTVGNVARRLLIRDVVNGVIGDPDQRDFYVCDNAIEGRLTWPRVYADDGGNHASDDGVNVQGEGHVVCHNVIIGFGDAMKVEQDGARAVDFYANEVRSAYDNGVELDGAAGNVRAFRNRFTNTFVPISVQPIFGGPAYVLRNVVVNAAEDTLKFYARGAGEEPNGVLVLHNTFVSAGSALLMASPATSHNFQFANNLFRGSDAPPAGKVVDWTGPIDDGTFDFDGWYPDGAFDFHAAGAWPSFAAMHAAGVFEAIGTLLSLPIFAGPLAPPPSYRTTMAPADATLAAMSNAVDAGIPLANVNDGATGAGPDLGALERGCPTPLFGVRPEGVDETNEPYGCGGPPAVTVITSIPSTALTMKDPVGAPTGRRFTFTSKSRNEAIIYRVTPPAAGTAGDPTLHGATLTVYNGAGSGEAMTVALPAAGWSVLGNAAAPSGYRFRATDGSSAVTGALVKSDKITIKGKGASWTYTLDEASQGRIAVRLQLGTDSPWCASTPARPSGNPPTTARNDRVGFFKGAPKSPPAPCPPLP